VELLLPVPAAAAELVTRARRSVRDDEGVRFVSRRFRNLWGRKRATLLTEFGSGSGNSCRNLNPISMPLQTPEFGSQFQNSDFLAQFCTTKRGVEETKKNLRKIHRTNSQKFGHHGSSKSSFQYRPTTRSCARWEPAYPPSLAHALPVLTTSVSCGVQLGGDEADALGEDRRQDQPPTCTEGKP
jgi:hypothetical protein